VKVFDDKGLANHIDPKPCAVGRETGGEASVGAYIGRLIEPRKFNSPERRRRWSCRKAIWMRAESRVRTQLCVVVGAGMCIRSFPGSRESSESTTSALMVRVGKTMSRSR